MKIILSRKGFDSANGGCASPILPDGTMISLPIPSDDPKTYADYGLAERLEKLKPAKGEPWATQHCHFDPDLERGAFGQAGAAATHLSNQGVKATHLSKQGVEDAFGLFLFFGWFRRVDDNYRYYGPDMHVIYGWMLADRVLTEQKEIADNYAWHPHAHPYVDGTARKNNRLYLASEYGTLKYHKGLVLTESGKSRSRWKLLPWMEQAQISHHSEKSIHKDEKDKGYFQSAAIGQEFVVQDNPDAETWALELIKKPTR